MLSYKVNIDLLNQENVIGVVGARNASLNARIFANKISKELVAHGCVIASGLARGIDTAAHEASAEKTIAVIAGGIDHIYPVENTNLYHKIAKEGLIISELPVGVNPSAKHFPQRNRLISGISLAVAVIEASLKSGSLITARCALEQNREVFAVPGFPMDPRSLGANQLIKEGANLLESAQDIINELSRSRRFYRSIEDAANDSNFILTADNRDREITDKMRKDLYEILSFVPINVENVVENLDLPIPIVYTMILEFELAGKITRSPGNKISLIYNEI